MLERPLAYPTFPCCPPYKLGAPVCTVQTDHYKAEQPNAAELSWPERDSMTHPGQIGNIKFVWHVCCACLIGSQEISWSV